MKHISLFSGIGGFELASEWMGWQNIASCELNEFCNKVLGYYWPEAYHHRDIHTFTYETINPELSKRFGSDWRSDDIILTGGFPCQPYSTAGKRLGKADDRHLWPEMLRAIREIQPRWVVGENVRGLISWNGGLVFDEVQADLEAEGYSVIPFILPAVSVNAPHRRDRVWFVAHARNISRGCKCGCENKRERKLLQDEQQGSKVRPSSSGCCSIRTAADTNGAGIQGLSIDTGTSNAVRQGGESIEKAWNVRPIGSWETFPTQSPVCTRNDGISGRLDGITFSKWRQESIKAGGNAIVPQVVYQIFKAIDQYNKL